MAYNKKDINDKYDKLKAQLKAGTIDKEKFKASANRLYNLYHSDANKATRNAASKPVSKPAAKATPAPKTGGKTGKEVLELGGSNVKVKQDDGTSRRNLGYTGVLPGTPEPQKPKKPRSNSQRNRSNRGGGVRGRSNRSTPKEGSTKTITVGSKSVAMVYKNGKWTPKKK